MTETSFAFETLTTKQVQALARVHVTRFERLLERGAHSTHIRVREDECQHYLALWKSVLAKTQAPNDAWKTSCTEEEKQEIEDACFSGDYDELLIGLVAEKGAA